MSIRIPFPVSHAAADTKKLVSKLRYEVNVRRRLKNPGGSAGRHDKIRKTITALIKHERIELNYDRGDECRGYAERLISDAIRYGDCHKETMEMADYWLSEKQLVHKLFKVLVPRYQDCPVSYTRMLKAPIVYPGKQYDKVVLELRNNIYPPLSTHNNKNRNYIHNILLDEARKEFRKAKYAEVAENIVSETPKIAEQQTTDLSSDLSKETSKLNLNEEVDCPTVGSTPK